jgi:hypothetical protein
VLAILSKDRKAERMTTSSIIFLILSGLMLAGFGMLLASGVRPPSYKEPTVPYDPPNPHNPGGAATGYYTNQAYNYRPYDYRPG